MPPSPLTLNAGPHDRIHAPVALPWPEAPRGGCLVDGDTDKVVPSQWHDGHLHFIVDRLPAGAARTYQFDENRAAPRSHMVRIKVDGDAQTLDVTAGGELLTTYRYSTQWARPHFYPVFGPGGVHMTRHFPMRDDVDGETKDHVHHRGLWVAYGDVNGTENWVEEPGHGWQTHRGMCDVINGPVFGQFTQTLDWENAERVRDLQETRTSRIYRPGRNAHLIDLTVALHAIDGDVHFGDTKEGGICSFRVPTPMDGDKSGCIENSYGGVGEEETWGKSAHWCGYSGPLDGKMMGVAIFDHPFNLRYPTPWHVRNYGLMTANPFGHSHYQSSLLKDGSYTLQEGDTLTFRYRVYLHRGDTGTARVGQRYHDYANPPMSTNA